MQLDNLRGIFLKYDRRIKNELYENAMNFFIIVSRSFWLDGGFELSLLGK